MRAAKKKELILSLIKDDLIHTKLISGLRGLGLDPSNYILGLSNTIFLLLNIKDDKQGEVLFERYLRLLQKVQEVEVTKLHDGLDGMAGEIYEELRKGK
jgi:hypothetical protein